MYLYSVKKQNRLEENYQIEDLLEACKQNNPKAQLEIYNRYYKAMYNTALRILHDSHDAEDVMQEAFIKAFDKLDSFQGTASFGAWLKRIVINESIGWLRKRRKNICLDEKIQLPDEPEIKMDTSDWQVKNLMNAINRLKDNYRIAISLHYIEGYDYEEMMQILGLSYANVRTLVSRAKNKLKILLTDINQ